MKLNPIQPLALDERNTLRFKENKIVRHLLDFATQRGCDMNELSCMGFTDDDRQQFAQLIGYTLSGYGELTGYVTDEAYGAAAKMAERGIDEHEARIEALTQMLKEARDGMRAGVASLFGIHPDDLK